MRELGANTPFEALVLSLRSCSDDYHQGVEEAPNAILWPDPNGDWKPLIGSMRTLLPELLILGEYKPDERTGPSIWLRCAIENTIEGIELPAEHPPILYLPGVARHELRNADQCRWDFQPLVELLYRGTVWSQRNGRDWTIEAFFVSEDSLDLDVAKDDSTRLSLRSALSAVASTPLTTLRGRRLEAKDFDAIVVGDTPRDVLLWIGAGEAVPAEWSQERWHAFRSRCQDDFGFDPDKEQPLAIAEKLGRKETKAWQDLWQRFCEAPAVYDGVREMLDRAQPMDLMALDGEPWPAINEREETKLRKALEELSGAGPEDAMKAILALGKEHAERRRWVWAKLGEAPLALALESLVALAKQTEKVPAFKKVEDYAKWYDDIGWQADAAALASYRGIQTPPDKEGVRAVIRALYLPWLDELCRNFQEVVFSEGFAKPEPVESKPGDCLLFVDGLRLDLAKQLNDDLEQTGYQVSLTTRHAALPPITSTAKPVVSPVAPLLEGKFLPPDFRTQFEGKELTHDVFKKLLAKVDCPWQDTSDIKGPASDDQRGWCEAGKVDTYGHKLGEELADHLPKELAIVSDTIHKLLAAGWTRVIVVTDHGWLLMPGNLPKFDLPGCVSDNKWSRTAAIKGESKPDVPQIPWYWNDTCHVAVPHGANAFKNTAYSHGGISPQECIIPVLTVSPALGDVATTRITNLKWSGLRCQIDVSGKNEGLVASVRLQAGNELASKPVEPDGHVSLLVSDDDQLGGAAELVVATSEGTVVATQTTTIGG
jgi:hypothetical protein